MQDALQSKNQLISVLAHDFINPLQGIIGIAGLLEFESETITNSKIKKFITSIVTSANSLSSQMIKVLDWVKSQDSNIEASPVEINLEVLLEDVIALEHGNATQKDITIKILSDYETNAFVDAHMISTVYRNLLTNALKFSDKGSRITIIIQELDSVIETIFIDSGKGISSELIHAILNTENPIESEYGTENEMGNGLGLRLCVNFIRKNSGSLSITQRENKGSVFTISLPKGNTKTIKQIRNIDTANQKSEIKSTHTMLQSVLIIDDTIETLDAIIESFGKSFKIYKANDGNDGLNKAKEIIPDIIICDINMPKLNGIELCAMLKEDASTNHIPIIIISSYSDEIIKEQVFKNGANDFIAKPFNALYLKNKVEALLEFRKKSIEQAGLSIDSKLPDSYDDVMFLKIIHFIDANISNNDLTADYVIEHIGVSKSYMWRLFKKKTNNSIGNYIREKKLQKAANMLMTGKYRINEISDHVGFSDSRYFSRIFMQEYGISPSDYANKYKGN